MAISGTICRAENFRAPHFTGFAFLCSTILSIEHSTGNPLGIL